MRPGAHKARNSLSCRERILDALVTIHGTHLPHRCQCERRPSDDRHRSCFAAVGWLEQSAPAGAAAAYNHALIVLRGSRRHTSRSFAGILTHFDPQGRIRCSPMPSERPNGTRRVARGPDVSVHGFQAGSDLGTTSQARRLRLAPGATPSCSTRCSEKDRPVADRRAGLAPGHAKSNGEPGRNRMDAASARIGEQAVGKVGVALFAMTMTFALLIGFCAWLIGL